MTIAALLIRDDHRGWGICPLPLSTPPRNCHPRKKIKKLMSGITHRDGLELTNAQFPDEHLLGSPWGSPCQQSLSFFCLISGYSRKTLPELSKAFVEHVLHVAWRRKIWTQVVGRQFIQELAWYSGFSHDHRFINKRNACTQSLTKEEWLVQASDIQGWIALSTG